MKIKLDENIPASLVADLAALGHDVDTVPIEGLQGQSDPRVWQAAQSAGRFLVTQDLDFPICAHSHQARITGCSWSAFANPGAPRFASASSDIFTDEPVESWSRCFVVAADAKVRNRRPVPPVG